MNDFVILLCGGVLATVLMAGLWGLHFRIKNAAIVDVGWAGGLAILGIFYAIAASSNTAHQHLVLGMAGVWGLRLAGHLLFDRVIGKAEDARYATLRRQWADRWAFKSFLFFQFQALLVVFLSFPFWIVARNTQTRLNGWEWAGLALWCIAMVGETLSDASLRKFKADPGNRGKTCRAGLWRYSRHPNYFFEWLIWMAWFIAALGSPWGWTVAACPALMLYFLLRVTGIPMTEEQAVKSRGEDYRQYQRTTSMFIPWFPRKAS